MQGAWSGLSLEEALILACMVSGVAIKQKIWKEVATSRCFLGAIEVILCKPRQRCLGLLADMSDFYAQGDEPEEDELDNLEVHAGMLLLTVDRQSLNQHRADMVLRCCRNSSL